MRASSLIGPVSLFNKNAITKLHFQASSILSIWAVIMSTHVNKLSPSDDEWQKAQAALAAAQAMPGGPARIEALKQAGRLRFEAAAKLVSSLAVSQAKDSIVKKASD
jgi:hypothetical protein